MTSEHWTDRLSEYIDGDLAEAQVRRLEAHLTGCEECRDTLDALRSVVAGAATLPAVAPARDLWPGIAGELRPRSAWRDVPPAAAAAPLTGWTRRFGPARPRPGGAHRVTATVPQLLAAAIALVVLSSGVAWLATSRAVESTGAAAASAAPAEGGAGSLVLASYQSVIDELEDEFELRREYLEPATIQVVERNLAIIDQAIAEARLALETDPASGFLNAHLASAMRRKTDLLRQAARIGRTEI